MLACAVKLVVWSAIPGRLRNEVDYAAVNIRTVLRTVWTAQNFDCFQARRFDQTEERSDAAALRAGRITNAINIDRDVSARQSTHKDGAQRRAGALQIHARLFVNNLRHDFRRALHDLPFVDDVYLRVDFASVGDLSCFCCDRDLFGDWREFQNYGDFAVIARRDVNG